MASQDPGAAPYFPPPPTSAYAPENASGRDQTSSFDGYQRGDARYAQDSRDPRDSRYAPRDTEPSGQQWHHNATPHLPSSTGTGSNQPYDQGFYPQAPTPPTSGRRKTHGPTYQAGEYVPMNNAAQYASSPYPPAPNDGRDQPRSAPSYDSRYESNSTPRSSYNEVSRYREPDRESRPQHHRARSDDAQRSSHYANLPQDSKQQNSRQKRLLAAVGGALAGGVGGKALGHDRYGTLAGAAAGAFGGPIVMDKIMDRNRAAGREKDSSDTSNYYEGKRGARSQRLLENNADYYSSRSDDEYDRRRQRKERRNRDYGRNEYEDDDDDYRGRSHHPDRGYYESRDDDRKSRGYSWSPTRSKTGYGLRARSKSIVDRFRAKITGGAVTDGDKRADPEDRRPARDDRYSRSRRDSYDDYYSDSEEEDRRSRHGDRRSRR